MYVLVVVLVLLNGDSENELRPQQKMSFKWRKPMIRVFSQRLRKPSSSKTVAPESDRPASASFIRRSVSNPFRSPRASASMDFDFGLFAFHASSRGIFAF